MISVCMATYNGSKYIKEQLESILSQLPEDAELIVSDDGSKDDTLDLVRNFRDTRIKIITGPGKGPVKNFENALREAKGEIIFLSDQDDVWQPDKLEKVLSAFDADTECVLHDAVVTDADGKMLMPSFFAWRKVHHGVLGNLMKNSYTGCCMTLTKELVTKALPFPEGIEMHDWWIGLLAERDGASKFIDDKLIHYRRHGENANSLDGYGIGRKIHNRLVFIKALLK